MPSGYIPVRSQTFNGYSLLRAIPKTSSNEDVAKAIALVNQLRIYPLSKVARAPEQRFVDMAGKLFDGVVRFDESFYTSLAQMLNEETVLTQDRAMMGLLLPLGIEKGKEFKPDSATQRVLRESAREAHAWLMDRLVTYTTPHWADSRWAIPAAPVASETNFSFERPNYLDVEARGIGYFSFYAPPKKLGAATFYVGTFKDTKGGLLRGEETYKLHVPPNVPAKQFWALTLYDRENCCFIRDMPRAGLDSYDQNMQKNADGSVDIYIGPKPPKGKEANWIQTASGRGWFPFFRFYGPKKPLFDKTWKLPGYRGSEITITAAITKQQSRKIGRNNHNETDDAEGTGPRRAHLRVGHDSESRPAGTDPQDPHRSSSSAAWHGHDQDLCADGGAHGVHVGLAAGQRGQPGQGLRQGARTRPAGRRVADRLQPDRDANQLHRAGPALRDLPEPGYRVWRRLLRPGQGTDRHPDSGLRRTLLAL
jgi:hypothetical protein